MKLTKAETVQTYSIAFPDTSMFSASPGENNGRPASVKGSPQELKITNLPQDDGKIPA